MRLRKISPIIAFIHKNRKELPHGKVESNAENLRKLDNFIDLAQKKMVRYWNTASELGSVVSRSIINLIKNNPSVGWVRGDNLPDESAAEEILRLKREIDKLRENERERSTTAPAGTEKLSQGDDVISMDSIVAYSEPGSYNTKRARWKTNVYWNEVMYVALPVMIDEATPSTIADRISNVIWSKDGELIQSALEGNKIKGIDVSDESMDTFIVQMVALGIIIKSVKNRSVKDRATYWTLTPFGENVMYTLRAVKRPQLEE